MAARLRASLDEVEMVVFREVLLPRSNRGPLPRQVQFFRRAALRGWVRPRPPPAAWGRRKVGETLGGEGRSSSIALRYIPVPASRTNVASGAMISSARALVWLRSTPRSRRRCLRVPPASCGPVGEHGQSL